MTGGDGELAVAGSGLAGRRPLEDFGLSSVESKNVNPRPTNC